MHYNGVIVFYLNLERQTDRRERFTSANATIARFVRFQSGIAEPLQDRCLFMAEFLMERPLCNVPAHPC